MPRVATQSAPHTATSDAPPAADGRAQGARARIAGTSRALIWIYVLILVGLVVAGFIAPLPYDPTTPNTAALNQPPSSSHLFGTDSSGFDVFSRTIRAGSRDLPLALVGTLLSLVIGVPLGLLAASRTRWSGAMMRGLDIFQAFPLLILAMAVVALTGNSINNIVFAIAVINVPLFIRLVRSDAIVLREAKFVEAATIIGCSPWRVMWRHVLPNVRGVILAQTSLAMGIAIVVIAALNFVGIGVRPPDPTWGSMMKVGAVGISQGDWWPVAFPALAVFIVILAFNGIANAIEEPAGLRYSRKSGTATI
jgi:peptide/nickel transport system permease protein